MMLRATVTMVCLAGLCALGISPALAQSMEELEVDHALTFDFPTPHTDWAQPYALGKTRVLFFTDGRGTNPRECVELMQRFDIEGEAVFWARIVDSTKTQWHGGDTGEQRMLNLLEKQWDCYVFLGLSLSKMSAEQQFKLLKPITEGAGIVFVGANDKRFLLEENRVAELPPFLARGPVGDAYTVGKGRAMRLPSRPNIGYYEGWEVDYDYWQERLGRAVLWAAGKEPQAQLDIKPLEPDFAWDQGKAFEVKLSGEVTGQKPMLYMRVRKPGDREFWWPVRDMPADTPVTKQMERLPAGAYRVDARVISSTGVQAWATAPFNVTSPRTVAEVNLFTNWGEIGDKVAGDVTLAGDALANESLRVRLLDRRRRVLARREFAPGDEPSEFDFAIEPWMSMLVTVEAQLLSGEDEVSRAYKYFRVTKRNRGEFNFLMWDVPRGTLAPYAEESLAKHSVTLQLGHGSPPVMLSAFDIPWVPYTTRIMTPKTEQGIMKPFCWNDEEAVRKHIEEKAEAYRPSRQHGVFVWSLGDENHTLGCCLSPHCARAYREYLKQEYGSLEALNESWTTEFENWDQVGLSKEGDNEEANSLQSKNYPRWFDRQAFKSYNYVMYCDKYAQAYEAIDPQAKTGFEGAGRFQRGDDLDLIIRTVKFWSPYPGTADEVVRSVAPRELPRANWMGYTKDADSLLLKYWRMVTRGMDSVWWWRWDCIGRFHGWLAPDFRPFPAVQEILEDTQIVRDGLGDLLLKSEMLDDGVAILYSYPSTFAHKLDEGASYGSYESACVAAQTLVRELGLQFSYVTDRMLRLGEFDASKYKVLILPRAEALGEREAQVIREFAEGGGAVIADVRPGIYNAHCKPRDKGILDDLFGVQREGNAPAKIATAEMKNAPVMSFEKAKVDPTVTGQGMGDAEGTPVLIVRKAGKGLAVLRNFAFGSEPKLSVADTSEVAAQRAWQMFAAAGVTPQVKLIAEAGARLRNIETIRWQDGDVEIMALFRQGGNEEPATVRLPEARYVYDLRNRKALGRVEEFVTEIIPNRASFFALCKQAPPTPKLTLDATTTQRGSVVKASISVPGAEGLHAFRVRAKTGDQELEWLNQNLIVGRESVSFDIPVAYNDPVGEYEISAIELFTNEATVVKLTVL